MQISKYKSPKLQIVGQNLLDPWDWSEQANMPRLGQLVIIWLGGRRHSLNKYAGGDDEFRMGTQSVPQMPLLLRLVIQQCSSVSWIECTGCIKKNVT